MDFYIHLKKGHGHTPRDNINNNIREIAIITIKNEMKRNLQMV